MGADLLIAHLWAEPDTEFDWEAGRRIAGELSDAEVLHVLEACPWLPDEAGDADVPTLCRERIDNHLTIIAECFTDPHVRNLTWVDTPDGKWRCWITGGMSWGDSPSDLWDAVNELSWAPKVLAAVGFRADDGVKVEHWDEHPGQPVADWQYEVANGDTRRGYHEWAEAKSRDEEGES